MATRRDFFKRVVKPITTSEENLKVRPPYARSEDAFSECANCQDKPCVLICYENIIKIDTDALPILDFSKSGCTFCEDCAKACERGVLSLNNIEKINAKFTISITACMAHNGTICFSCKEPCIEDAILFNGLFNPVIDGNKCTGCGFCISRCPTNAISFKATRV